jgi:hypothetical protein
MHLLLFVLYCGLCGFGILKIPFFRKTGIRPAFLLTLFGLHVVVGCLHNLIAWRFYPDHGDIWFYFQFSFLERSRLFHDTHLFLHYNSSWDAISHNAITFIQIILDWLSFDDMWINTLLFSLPVFLGNAALYRAFRRQFPGSPLSALTAFLLPSTLFWTSCIHREAVLFALLGLLFYWLDKSVCDQRGADHQRPGTRRVFFIYAACAFLAIVFFRFAVALVLVPALLAWLLSLYPPTRRQRWIIGGIGVALIIIIVLLPQIPAVIAAQQRSFMILQGNSKLYLPVVTNSWTSLLHTAPAALRNGLFEPLPGSGGQRIYQLFSLELLCIWALAAAALVRRTALKPFSVCCIAFAGIGMLQIGYIVPFAGAIVRYRSIYLPFLLAPYLFELRTWRPFYTFNAWFSKAFLINYE